MKLQCKRCKISWIPRIEGRPKWCPSCHSPYWDKDRVRGVVVAVEPVKVSQVLVSKPKEPAKIAEPEATCKCGGTGVMIVNGKKCCAKCGRALGA
jgi:hypothetical protein